MPSNKKQSLEIIPIIEDRLRRIGDPEQAQFLQRFFKTGPGEYGEGDIFVGIRVPVIRKLAKEYQTLPVSTTFQLLQSPIHEARLLALLILVRHSRQTDPVLQKQICDTYLQHTRFINSWDLVDCSAHHIVGPQITHFGPDRLLKMAASPLLWDRRISIISTFYLIKRGEFRLTLQVAEKLLHDPEDLIHKAVGWMLREVGKGNQEIEESFLKGHYRTMPRTMLRYAIEKFPEEIRQSYLKGERVQSRIK
jgi:3-methyladenine DNA glycosylase AlkD